MKQWICAAAVAALLALPANAAVPFVFLKPGGTPGASSTLNNGLVAHFKLDEASGTRAQSAGPGPLTELGGGTGSAGGKIGNAASFAADSDMLTGGSDITGFDGIDFAIACWVYIAVEGVIDQVILDKPGEYTLLYDPAADRFKWAVGGTTNTANFAVATGTWYLLVMNFDEAGDEMSISANAGMVYTEATAASGAALGAALFVGGDAATETASVVGRLDSLSFWTRTLTSGEIAELYALNAGKDCCPFPAP